MRQQNISIWKYFIKKPKYEPHKLWVPNEEEEDLGRLGAAAKATQAASLADGSGAGVSVVAAMAQVSAELTISLGSHHITRATAIRVIAMMVHATCRPKTDALSYALCHSFLASTTRLPFAHEYK